MEEELKKFQENFRKALHPIHELGCDDYEEYEPSSSFYDAHTPPEPNRHSSVDDNAPPLPERPAEYIFGESQSSSVPQKPELRKRNPHSKDEEDDDIEGDLYIKKGPRILENIPLEYLEKEVERRKNINPFDPLESSLSTIRDPQKVFASQISSEDNSKTPSSDFADTPPPLPPRVPIENEDEYVPNFSTKPFSPSVISTTSSWQSLKEWDDNKKPSNSQNTSEKENLAASQSSTSSKSNALFETPSESPSASFTAHRNWSNQNNTPSRLDMNLIDEFTSIGSESDILTPTISEFSAVESNGDFFDLTSSVNQHQKNI